MPVLRRLQKWLHYLRNEAHSTNTASPVATDDRRRLVARKRLDELGLGKRLYRCALYALTDTLDDIGVTVSLLEYAKGTLHVSGDSKF